VKKMDLKKAADLLRAIGYDVVVGDGEISARRDDVAGVQTIYMDGAGRVRIVFTRMGDVPRGRRVERNGKEFRILREVQESTTVMTEIDSEKEIPLVLEDISLLVTQPEEDAPAMPSRN